MSEMKKTVTITEKDVSIDGEIMYLRLMAVNSRKKVPLSRVMSFENAPVPLSLFTEEGIMVSCKKSDYMHKLEELIPGGRLTTVEACDVIIFDGHAIIHLLPAHTLLTKATFQDTAEAFMNHVMSHSKDSASIHVIFDKYIMQNNICNQGVSDLMVL